MLSELFSTIKTAFTLMIFIIAIVVAVGVIRGINEHREAEKRREREQQRKHKDINRIKSASKRWTREHKIYFMQEIAKEYNRLAECQRKPVGQGYACKTIIMANIDGDLQMISMDLQGLNEVYSYLKGML